MGEALQPSRTHPRAITEEVQRHPEVLASSAVLRRVEQGDQEPALYSTALRTLSAALTAHYGEPTVILIDEYDAPIQAAYAEGFYKEAVTFFRTFLTEGLKDNRNLFKGVLTGVLRVAGEHLLGVEQRPRQLPARRQLRDRVRLHPA